MDIRESGKVGYHLLNVFVPLFLACIQKTNFVPIPDLTKGIAMQSAINCPQEK